VRGQRPPCAALLWNVSTRHRDARVAASSRALPEASAAPRLSSIYFDAGQATLDSDDWRVIESIATAAQRAGSVLVTGYTDRSGDPQQNLALAQQRASAVRDGLLSKGVRSSNIFVNPPTFSREGDAQRERVEISICCRV